MTHLTKYGSTRFRISPIVEIESIQFGGTLTPTSVSTSVSTAIFPIESQAENSLKRVVSVNLVGSATSRSAKLLIKLSLFIKSPFNNT